MPRYLVSIQICSPDLVVEADSPSEARELANAFIDDKGADYCDLVESMDADVYEVEELDPEVYDMSIGIDKDDCFNIHDLDEKV